MKAGNAAPVGPRRRRGAFTKPQRYLNNADLGLIAGAPGQTVFSNIFFVEGFLQATLQAQEVSGSGSAFQFIEVAQQTGSENDGYAGASAVIQVLAFAGWLSLGVFTPLTWSFARVRPIARTIRLRFRHTNAGTADDWQMDLRLLLRAEPHVTRLRVS